MLFVILGAGAAYGQFPANPNKIRLEFQTSADGLVYRTDSIPDWTTATRNDALYIYTPAETFKAEIIAGGAVISGKLADGTTAGSNRWHVQDPDRQRNGDKLCCRADIPGHAGLLSLRNPAKPNTWENYNESKGVSFHMVRTIHPRVSAEFSAQNTR